MAAAMAAKGHIVDPSAGDDTGGCPEGMASIPCGEAAPLSGETQAASWTDKDIMETEQKVHCNSQKQREEKHRHKRSAKPFR